MPVLFLPHCVVQIVLRVIVSYFFQIFSSLLILLETLSLSSRIGF